MMVGFDRGLPVAVPVSNSAACLLPMIANRAACESTDAFWKPRLTRR